MHIMGMVKALRWGTVATKFFYKFRKNFKDDQQSQTDLTNKVVVITGGSKGLGFILARDLLKEGCRIAICARDLAELQDAQSELEDFGEDISIHTCDVGKEDEVNRFIGEVIERHGRIDILINNAGIIQVGPMETFKHEDYKAAMDVMYWGVVNPTLAVLPHMKERQEGQIINVTSVGGKVSVPHLVPYNASKFAAVGFSEGITSELRKDNIYVTTVVPWLMRTGSYVNALFQKGNTKEFKLFSLASSTPGITLDAEKAAQRIIEAIRDKKALKVVGPQARLAIELDHFFPELTTKIFSLISRIIPSQEGVTELEKGEDINERENNAEVPGIRQFGQKAKEEFQEHRNVH